MPQVFNSQAVSAANEAPTDDQPSLSGGPPRPTLLADRGRNVSNVPAESRGGRRASTISTLVGDRFALGPPPPLPRRNRESGEGLPAILAPFGPRAPGFTVAQAGAVPRERRPTGERRGVPQSPGMSRFGVPPPSPGVARRFAPTASPGGSLRTVRSSTLPNPRSPGTRPRNDVNHLAQRPAGPGGLTRQNSNVPRSPRARWPAHSDQPSFALERDSDSDINFAAAAEPPPQPPPTTTRATAFADRLAALTGRRRQSAVGWSQRKGSRQDGLSVAQPASDLTAANGRRPVVVVTFAQFNRSDLELAAQFAAHGWEVVLAGGVGAKGFSAGLWAVDDVKDEAARIAMQLRELAKAKRAEAAWRADALARAAAEASERRGSMSQRRRRQSAEGSAGVDGGSMRSMLSRAHSNSSIKQPVAAPPDALARARSAGVTARDAQLAAQAAQRADDDGVFAWDPLGGSLRGGGGDGGGQRAPRASLDGDGALRSRRASTRGGEHAGADLPAGLLAPLITAADPALADTAAAAAAESAGACVSFMRLDVGSLQSVVRFAQRFKSKYRALDCLVLSSDCRYSSAEARGAKGVVAPLVGLDGYEYIVTANMLSPFLALSLLLRELNAAPQARVLLACAGTEAMVEGGPGLSLRAVDELLSLQGAWDEHRWAGRLHSELLARRTARGRAKTRAAALAHDMLEAMGWSAEEERFHPDAQAQAAQVVRLLLASQAAKMLEHTRVRVGAYDPRSLFEEAGAESSEGESWGLSGTGEAASAALAASASALAHLSVAVTAAAASGVGGGFARRATVAPGGGERPSSSIGTPSAGARVSLVTNGGVVASQRGSSGSILDYVLGSARASGARQGSQGGRSVDDRHAPSESRASRASEVAAAASTAAGGDAPSAPKAMQQLPQSAAAAAAAARAPSAAGAEPLPLPADAADAEMEDADAVLPIGPRGFRSSFVAMRTIVDEPFAERAATPLPNPASARPPRAAAAPPPPPPPPPPRARSGSPPASSPALSIRASPRKEADSARGSPQREGGSAARSLRASIDQSFRSSIRAALGSAAGRDASSPARSFRSARVQAHKEAGGSARGVSSSSMRRRTRSPEARPARKSTPASGGADEGESVAAAEPTGSPGLLGQWPADEAAAQMAPQRSHKPRSATMGVVDIGRLANGLGRSRGGRTRITPSALLGGAADVDQPDTGGGDGLGAGAGAGGGGIRRTRIGTPVVGADALGRPSAVPISASGRTRELRWARPTRGAARGAKASVVVFTPHEPPPREPTAALLGERVYAAASCREWGAVVAAGRQTRVEAAPSLPTGVFYALRTGRWLQLAEDGRSSRRVPPFADALGGTAVSGGGGGGGGGAVAALSVVHVNRRLAMAARSLVEEAIEATGVDVRVEQFQSGALQDVEEAEVTELLARGAKSNKKAAAGLAPVPLSPLARRTSAHPGARGAGWSADGGADGMAVPELAESDKFAGQYGSTAEVPGSPSEGLAPVDSFAGQYGSAEAEPAAAEPAAKTASSASAMSFGARSRRASIESIKDGGVSFLSRVAAVVAPSPARPSPHVARAPASEHGRATTPTSRRSLGGSLWARAANAALGSNASSPGAARLRERDERDHQPPPLIAADRSLDVLPEGTSRFSTHSHRSSGADAEANMPLFVCIPARRSPDAIELPAPQVVVDAADEAAATALAEAADSDAEAATRADAAPE